MTALWFVILAGCVSVVGIMLARSSDRLGESLHLDRSITGFLMLAAATSLPELVVGCQVARSGAVDMAVGSLLGSCLMNLLILAAIDLSRRNRGRILSAKAAAHGLSGLASILLASIVAVAVLSPSSPTIGRMHIASFVIVAAYFATIRIVYLDRAISQLPNGGSAKPKEKARVLDKRQIFGPASIYVIAAVLLLLLASPLAETSENFAGQLGWSGTFFGAVFLALVTSLPEIVTTYEASRIDAEDMAMGNILGSNAFNLLIFAGIDLSTPEPLFSSLDNVNAIAALGIIVTTTIASMGMLYRVEKRWLALEPDAMAVIVVALGFFYLIYTG